MPTIRIQQHSFTLSDPFLPGHLLSPEEASALNGLRAENIRNILGKRIAAVSATNGGGGSGGGLSEEALLKIEEEAARLDREYQFGVRRAYNRPGPIERVAMEIARAKVVAAARRDGETLSEEQLASEALQLVTDPEVLAEARAQVTENQKVASEALESLL